MAEQPKSGVIGRARPQRMCVKCRGSGKVPSAQRTGFCCPCCGAKLAVEPETKTPYTADCDRCKGSGLEPDEHALVVVFPSDDFDDDAPTRKWAGTRLP